MGRNFGEYEKVVTDIQFCGKYRELMCLCPRPTFDLITSWLNKFGKEATYELILLICDCAVPTPPTPPTPSTPTTPGDPGLPPIPPPPTPPTPPPPTTSQQPICAIPVGGGQ
jgi:hypothetical protein